MGTMGPVSEEPGLSLWDAMSVLCPAPAGRGVGGRQLGDPGSERRAHSPFNRKSASIWESLWRWSPLMSAGAPSEAGGKGRRGDADRRDRPVREDGSSRGAPGNAGKRRRRQRV